MFQALCFIKEVFLSPLWRLSSNLKAFPTVTPTNKMTQKSVLITSCSNGGIGDALARAFNKKGLRVFATARNQAKIQHLNDMDIEVIQLDIVDDVSIKQAVEAVRARTGGTLDILVNNSGRVSKAQIAKICGG